jgi:hypothetical protein
MKEMYKYLKKERVDALLISGTTREIKMYAKFGFKPFYKMTGKEGAYYQPMYLDIGNIEEHAKWIK